MLDLECVEYGVQEPDSYHLNEVKLRERMQCLVGDFRRLKNILNYVLITVYTILHGILNLHSKEFFEISAASNLRGRSPKVRQPCFPRKAASVLRTAGLWNRLSLHVSEALTVPILKGPLDNTRSGSLLYVMLFCT